MASSILKGLVTNYGKLGYQLWHRPLKMASLVYEREIGTGAMPYQLSYEATHWEHWGIAEVMGSNPVEALIFFRLLLSNCLNWKFTAMITLHFHLIPQYKYELFHICFTVYVKQEKHISSKGVKPLNRK